MGEGRQSGVTASLRSEAVGIQTPGQPLLGTQPP